MRVFTIAMLALGLALVSGTTVLAAIEVDVQVSPHTLLIGATQGDITVHVDIAFSTVTEVKEQVTLNGVPATALFADDCGDLVARFPELPVKATTSDTSVMTLVGVTRDGVPFTGSNTVNVRTFRGKGR